MGGFGSLSEFLAHLEQSLHQGGTLVTVNLRNLVLFEQEIGGLNVVVHLVSCLVLEHLGQELRRRNVRVEFFTLVLDGTALVLYDNTPIRKASMFTYFEYHGPAPLAVLQLDVVANEGLAVHQRRSDVIGLVDVL